MSPTLYHVPKTISSPIVQTLLELDDSDVVVKTLTFNDLKDPAYLEINPMGTSPAFTDNSHDLEGEITLFESGAIMSWILEEYDAEGKLHPREYIRNLLRGKVHQTLSSVRHSFLRSLLAPPIISLSPSSSWKGGSL